MNCCDDDGNCSQGPDCPIRAHRAHLLRTYRPEIPDRLLHRMPLPEAPPASAPAPLEDGDGWAPLTPYEALTLLLGALPFAACGLALVGILIWVRWA